MPYLGSLAFLILHFLLGPSSRPKVKNLIFSYQSRMPLYGRFVFLRMMKLSALVLLLICDHKTWAKSSQERIVGGVELPIHLSPWLASISVHGNYSCSSALITSQWLVTAGHCVYYPDSYVVRAGSVSADEGGQQRDVARIILHPEFKIRTLENDIALLKIRKSFILGGNVQLVKLPLPGLNILPRNLLLAGWGTVSANDSDSAPELRGTLVEAIDQRHCRHLYSHLNRRITDNMLCAAAPGRDHCFGDSGAPLVHRGSSYGIVSFAHGCADPHFPGVYTRLANYVNWIFSVLKTDNKQNLLSDKK
ncbi:trypsin [Drosophila rhopaloa]|uniref:trypsin n=1 Tax=Drosophila rhopaloa TaxID=1041015 RepID=A0ABM5I6K3_DRORH|nr:trypsin [Drosophila rhopaloa]